MNPLKRNNPGVRATDHENRIAALERRVFDDSPHYATVPLENVAIGANDSQNIPPDTTGIVFSDNTDLWTVSGYGVCYDYGVGGFFHVFAAVNNSADFPEYEGFLTCRKDVVDENGTSLGTQSAVWTYDGFARPTATLSLSPDKYRAQGLWYSRITDPTERVRFYCQFLNIGAGTGTVSGISLTVVRYNGVMPGTTFSPGG